MSFYDLIREKVIRGEDVYLSQNDDDDVEEVYTHEKAHIANDIDEVQDLISQEKRKEIANIEEDTIALNDIVKDLSLLVHEQSEPLDLAMTNIEESKDNVEESIVHLDSANEMKFNGMKRGLTWSGILTGVGVTIGGCALSAFHPFIGIPIIAAGVGGIITSVKVGNVA